MSGSSVHRAAPKTTGDSPALYDEQHKKDQVLANISHPM